MNQYESAAISQQLQEYGMQPSGDDDCADVCIINTCTVTQKAAYQSRQTIRRLIRSNPEARIVVTGCYAQIDSGGLTQHIDGIDDIIDNAQKHLIPEHVYAIPSPALYPPNVIRDDIRHEKRFAAIPITVTGDRTRPLLKIQDGCNSTCAYCVVPYTRGRSRSLPVKTVIRHIDNLVRAGYHEVVLTGIHLGNYGRDLTPITRLPDLLKSILDKAPIHRIRLSSIEPLEFTTDLIELLEDDHRHSHRMCHHFHIPLQSGDDGILRKMRRPYTRDFFKQCIRKIHRHFPDAAIGIDTLIGFPGETETAFQNTYDLIASLPVTYLHVFPFSARQGTSAFAYPQQLSQADIKERCHEMRRLSDSKKEQFYKRFINREMEVLVESKRHFETGLLKGLTTNYIPVLITGDDNLANRLITVRIDHLEGNGLVFGSPVSMKNHEEWNANKR